MKKFKPSMCYDFVSGLAVANPAPLKPPKKNEADTYLKKKGGNNG